MNQFCLILLRAEGSYSSSVISSPLKVDHTKRGINAENKIKKEDLLEVRVLKLF